MYYHNNLNGEEAEEFVQFSPSTVNHLTNFNRFNQIQERGSVASWVMRSSPDQAALVQSGVLCCWVRHLTLSSPVYKWVYDGSASHPGGVEILLVTSCYRNRDKLRPDGPLAHIAVTKG